MTNTIYNFSAGPAMMPPEVLETARQEMLSLDGIGMSVMELSHRSAKFIEILDRAEAGLRRLLGVPDHYRILFMQGGASLQFSMIPMNFLKRRGEYVITGAWGKKAAAEARKFGAVAVPINTESTGFRSIPEPDQLRFHPDSDYIHYCSNETIDGVEFKYDLDGGGIPVICDASSNILSKPIDLDRYALIYAGAQKNIGPSGVTVVIIRDDLIAKVPANQAAMLDYREFAVHQSMPNTPNTWGIYLISLVCEWLEREGGVRGIAVRNAAKAKLLYDALDASDGYFRPHADREARSAMNVTFRLPSEELEERFLSAASANGFSGLKGHRSVGGIRASIYNAFPVEGVERFVEFMTDFRAGS